MNFAVEVKEISSILKRVLPFVGKVDVQKNILLKINKNDLVVKAHNEAMSITAKGKILSNDEFNVVVEGRKFEKYVNAFDDYIDIEVKDNVLVLKENKSKLQLPIITNEFYPEKPSTIIENRIEFPLANFTDGIKKVMDFTNKEIKSEATTQGINLDFCKNKLNISATNGNFLSICEYDITDNLEVNLTIPIRLAQEIAKYNDESFIIYPSERAIKFEFENIEIVSSVLGGKFPKIKEIIPAGYENNVTFDKKELENIFKKIDLIKDEDMTAIYFDFDKENAKIKYTTKNGIFEDIINCDLKGKCELIKLSYKYLPIVMNNLEEKVTFEYEQDGYLILFRNKNNRMVLAVCK